MESRHLPSKDLFIPAYSSIPIAIGTCVSVTGSKVNNQYPVTPAIPDQFDTIPAVGIVTCAHSVTDYTVQVQGIVRQETLSLVIGATYKVGMDSALTSSVPVPLAGDKVAVQTMGLAIAEDELLLFCKSSIIVSRG